MRRNILIGLIIMCFLLQGCEDKNIKENDAEKYEKKASLEKVQETNIVIREHEIMQWAIKNTGEIPGYLANLNSWEWDEKKAIEKCDINYIDVSGMEQKECIVAIVDTEVDIFHDDFRQIWINKDEIADDGQDNDNNGMIDDIYGWNFCDNNNIVSGFENAMNAHGTFLAGILCATNERFQGVLNNSKCEVMCIKALSGEEATGHIEDVIRAIKYAEENGAVICCLSLATYIHSVELYDCIKNSKMLFVTPSANYGMKLSDDLLVYPACYELDNIICVGDLRCDGNLSLLSNYGEEYVDVAAPGTDIVSTLPQNRYGYESGTSCAVAYVAGLAGLVYACSDVDLNPCDIKQLICENVTYDEKLIGKIKYQGFINYGKTISAVYKGNNSGG